MVDLGALRVGEEVIKKVPLVNRSAIPVTFSVSLMPSTSSPELQKQSDVLKVTYEEMTLKPNGGTGDVAVTFRPKARIPRFQEEVRDGVIECTA